MPLSRHTAAQKLAILEEADTAPRGYRGTSGKAVVCAKYGIGVSTLALWRSQRDQLRERAERDREKAAP